MIVIAYLLIAISVGFAISIGAHYTGACMGMPYAAGAVRLGPALLMMAPLAFIGAAVASERVETTVGHGILAVPTVTLGLALAVVTSALVLTSAYNFVTIPTSTIQILVFSTVGAGLAAGISISWSTIGVLVALWALAPFAAFAAGYLFVRSADRWAPTPAGRPVSAGRRSLGWWWWGGRHRSPWGPMMSPTPPGPSS